MRLNKLMLFISIASLTLSGKVSALGLGEITLKSALNEPLDAEIRLLQIRDLSEEEILVGLASNADFDRVGVEKSFFLSGMAFSVDLDAPNGPVVKIKTNSPVREPFLNFLVESQWPSGRILREYTLLMDLPTFSAQEASSVQAPEPAAETTVQATPAPASPPPATVRTRPVAPQPTSYASGTYGPVNANDTLWNIALEVRPGREFSVQQTMIAIQRLNPDAFINDNINLLKRGQVLRIPDSDQIRELNFNQAVSEVAFQNDQWDTKSATKATLVADSQAPSQPVKETAGGRITLGVGGDNAANDTASATGSDASGDAQSLQNDLGNTLEQLDTANRENTELRSRISELEAQIETMERLVEVSSAELRALQLASEQQAKEPSEAETASVEDALAEVADAVEAPVNEVLGTDEEAPNEETPDAELKTAAQELDIAGTELSELGDTEASDIADSTELESASTDLATAAAEESEPEAPSAETTPVKPDARTVVTTGSSKKPGLLDTIMDNIVLIAAVLIAVLVAAFALLKKLFGNKDDELEDTFNPFEEDPILEEDEIDNKLGDEFEDHSATIGEEIELEDDQLVPEQPEEEGEAAIVPADVIAETDIYIAYGKFDQAEEMLEKAIAVEPENNAARLKLLEVHAGANNLDGFDKTLSELYQSEDQAAIDRGNELRTGFKNIAPFALAGAASAAVSSVTQSLESDDDVTHKDLSQEFAELDSLDSVDDLDDDVIEDFDFDLDPEFDLGEETADAIDEELGEAADFDDETKLNLAEEFSSLNEDEPNNEVSQDISDSADELKTAVNNSLDETDVTIQRKLSDLELEAIGDSEDSVDAPESLLAPGLDLVSDSMDGADTLDQTLADMDPASNDDFEPSLDFDDLSLDSVDDALTSPNSDNVLSLTDVSLDIADDPNSLQDIDIEQELASTEDSLATLDIESQADELALDAESSSIELTDSDKLEPSYALEEVESAALDLDDGLDLTLEQPDFDEAGLDAIDGELQAAGNTYDNLESSTDFLSDSDLELDIADLDLETESLSNDSEANSLIGQGLVDNELELSVDEELEIDGDEIANIGAFQPSSPSDLTDIDSDAEAETGLLQDADLDALDEEMDALAADVGLDQLTTSTISVNEPVLKDDENYNSEEVFAEVLASTEQNLDDIETDEGLSDDFDEGMDFLADTDESDTKLDLARAYIDMGDGEGARDILNEVLSDGNDEQKEEAQTLIEKIPG